ncbi:hypothetical protein NL676_018450 [Syzygium grande]|nr:hypothetical protein NL676_018450 [Syzygium grande]
MKNRDRRVDLHPHCRGCLIGAVAGGLRKKPDSAHCAMHARDACKWVGFFDGDKFFHFPTGLFLDDLQSDANDHCSLPLAIVSREHLVCSVLLCFTAKSLKQLELTRDISVGCDADC